MIYVPVPRVFVALAYITYRSSGYGYECPTEITEVVCRVIPGGNTPGFGSRRTVQNTTLQISVVTCEVFFHYFIFYSCPPTDGEKKKKEKKSLNSPHSHILSYTHVVRQFSIIAVVIVLCIV